MGRPHIWPLPDPLVDKFKPVTVYDIKVDRKNGLYHLKIEYFLRGFEFGGSKHLEEASGFSLEDIRVTHPQLFEDYIRPHGPVKLIQVIPVQAWQFFLDDFVPSDETNKLVKDAISDFAKDDWRIRLNAESRIRNDACFLTVLKMTRKGLDAEQNMRLDCSMTSGDVISATTIEKLKDNPTFLLDCLPLADDKLKALIKDRLTKLNVKIPAATQPAHTMPIDDSDFHG